MTTKNKAITLADAFGLPTNVHDVADYVKNFQSRVNVKSKHDYLNFGLAPSYGTLTSESIKKMDDELKIIIYSTTKLMSTLKDKSWANVISALEQNTLLQPMEQGAVKVKVSKFSDEGTGLFKFDGGADNATVKKVCVWFKSFIDDEDILKSTGLDIKVLAKIVAKSGASVDSVGAFFAKNEYREKTMVEIGVLRYPDIDNPFFKAYRIKLVAFSDCSRVLFVQKDKNGIIGEFAVRCYKPRASVIAGLREETKKTAIQEAEDLLMS